MQKHHQLVILIVLLILPGTLVMAADDSEKQSQTAALICGVDSWDHEVLYDFEADDGGFMANTPPGEWAWGAPPHHQMPIRTVKYGQPISRAILPLNQAAIA